MTLYVDSSALAKRYVEEPESGEAERLLMADTEWVTGNHTYVEVFLALGRRLEERAAAEARESLERDWRRLYVVALDDATCRRAAVLGSITGSRALDALHLATAERAGGRAMPFVTFDVRQARAARSLGLVVLGV